MDAENEQPVSLTNAHRRRVIAILRESIKRNGKPKTCKIFEIGSRATLDNWIDGGPMRISNIRRVLRIAREINFDKADYKNEFFGLATKSYQSKNKSVTYLVDMRYCQPGEFVIDGDRIGIIEEVDNDPDQFIIRKADSVSVVSALEILPVLIGTVQPFDETHKPKLTNSLFNFQFETIGKDAPQ